MSKNKNRRHRPAKAGPKLPMEVLQQMWATHWHHDQKHGWWLCTKDHKPGKHR